MATEARVFVSPSGLERTMVLRGGVFHYLTHVLRLKPGARVTVLDGEGRQAQAHIQSVRADEIELLAEEPTRATQVWPRIVLLCGILKGEKQDFVLQKATELGASRIVPVQCEHSVPKLLGERGANKRSRWTEIVRHAAQQCRRMDVPELDGVMAFSEALACAEGRRLLLFEGKAPPVRVKLPPTGQAASITLLVGPEGGFTKEEIAQAEAAGFAPVSLGPFVLRAETAVVAALSVVGYAWWEGASDDAGC